MKKEIKSDPKVDFDIQVVFIMKTSRFDLFTRDVIKSLAS